MAPYIDDSNVTHISISTSTTSTYSDDLPSSQSCHACSDQNHLEPIAVVGLSLKFPQDATSPESFWTMLMDGRCAMTDLPNDRMNLAAFFHPDAGRQDAIPLRGGHFLQDDIAAFDAPFFSISPAEAAAMDPQQRMLLETSYRALENAGIPLEKALGSKTSVYTGCFTDDYKMINSRDPEQSSNYAIGGLAFTMLANRLSWFYNFSGPSINLDSACSSSLMALDIACQGLRNGDANMSLVAGCNLIYSPDWMFLLSNMGFLSPDSRCFSFDHRANGYARGEGFGVVVIKRLSDAIHDGNVIRAVIRSTGSNQDGHTPGITQPDRDAQERLIRETYAKAGLSMKSTRFFEAHGTGTSLGDPIEANALGEAFRKQRSAEDPLYIGAVKSNIGHLEGASGIAGLIKAVLVLERGIIPPNTNFERLNMKIDSDYLNIKFPRQAIPWPVSGLRRASVNSFGFGGANAHAVLDDAYNYLRIHDLAGKHCTVTSPPSLNAMKHLSEEPNHGKLLGGVHGNFTSYSQSIPKPTLLIWSAADVGGLERLSLIYSQHFARLSIEADKVKAYLESLAFTLSQHRSSLPWKSFLNVKSLTQLHDLKRQLTKPIRSAPNLRLGFVFTGQGAQWYAMGRELLFYPVFKNSLQNAELCLRSLGCQWSLMDEFLKDATTSRISRPEISQPLCTALQVALIDLLQSFNLIPAVVVGHSSGEIAAAYSIGALSARSAHRVAYCRGALSATLSGSDTHNGAMIAVGLSEAQLLPYLGQIAEQHQEADLVIACFNSPKSVTVSGGELYINALKLLLEKDSVFARLLNVDIAYHSPRMRAIAAEYLSLVEDLEVGNSPSRPVIMISSVTASRVSVEDVCQGSYWVQNMIAPVRFSEAIKEVCSHSANNVRKKLNGSHRQNIAVHNLLEIGPHSALQGPIRDIFKTIPKGQDIGYDSMLVRHIPALDTTLEMAGRMHCLGYSINLSNINRYSTGSLKCAKLLTDLPEYPFDHSKTYWHESRVSKGLRFREHPKLDLLGSRVSDWNPLEGRWRNFLKISDLPWIEDHKINDSIMYPAAGILVMAIEAANQVADKSQTISGFRIKDATFHAPLNIPVSQTGIEVQFCLRPLREASEKHSTWSEFRLYVYEEGRWNETCRGTIQVEYEVSWTEVDEGKEVNKELSLCQSLRDQATVSCTKAVDSEQLYRYLQDCGFHYGAAFQSLGHVYCNDGGLAKANVKLFQRQSNETTNHAQLHIIHPTTLDGVMQLVFAALTRGGADPLSTTIPTKIKNLWVSSVGLSHPNHNSINAVARSVWKGYRVTESSIFVLDERGDNLRAQIGGLEMTTVASSKAPPQPELKAKQNCFHIDWQPDITMLDQQQIVAYCQGIHYGSTAADPVEFFQDLGFLLLVFISKTLNTLVLEEPLAVRPYLQKYIAWMRLQLERFQNGTMPYSLPEWEERLKDTETEDALCTRVQTTNNQGKLFVKVGQNLTRILKGEIDPLDLLFRDDLAKDFYQDMNDSVHCFDAFGRYLDLLAYKNPRMKILEVGAGTGGATFSLLSTLSKDNASDAPRYAQYDFTDVSKFFLENAQDSFKDHERMYFKTLNIEENPVEQGFEAESYDLIIAANVLHATHNLSITIQNIRRLLKPGGKLMLFEITRPDILRCGFAFGLLPGWWLSTEDYREWGPCISPDMWHELLTENGFSGTDLVLDDFQNVSCHELSIMVSTAIEQPPKLACHPKTIIISEQDSSMQSHMAQVLRIQLELSGDTDHKILSLQEAVLKPDLSDSFCIFLNELEQPMLRDLDPHAFYALRRLLASAGGILWVSNSGAASYGNPDHGMVDGLARVLRAESDGLIFVTLELGFKEAMVEQHVKSILGVVEKTRLVSSSNAYEPMYKEVDGILHINRVVEASVLTQTMSAKGASEQSAIRGFGEGPPLEMHIQSPGLLDTLCFVEDVGCLRPLDSDEVEVEVKAIGMNFMDCLVALGRLNESTMGSECAGIVSRVGQDCDLKPGDRVCMGSLHTYRTFARSKFQNVVKIPDDLSFNEAAALPTTFITAYHALYQIARMEKGESVLIHAGAGGTGQAAIQVSKYFDVNANIFVTVGSEKKKRFIMERYDIPEDHIFYSRDLSFARGIKRMTKGVGVDIILNSLAGEGLVASWECIAPYGRFIEIGKQDIHADRTLPMFPFAKNVSFSAVDVAAIMAERPTLIQKTLREILAMVAAKKLHTAEPLQVYNISEAEQAFRVMQSGKNIGKTVLEANPNDQVPTILRTKPSYQFDTSKTYLICGGLGGLGRTIARWMVSRGVRNLILLSRSGPQSQAAIALLGELKAYGAHIETPICDAAEISSLRSVLEHCSQTMPSIAGCVQASMVLKDALFTNMTYEDWKASIDPKVCASWNLHTLLPAGMDFFILLSSICGIIGQGGQANYAAGNTYMDALAHHRIALGEKAASIDLGVMVSDGFLVENQNLLDRMLAGALYHPLTRTDLLALLDYYCDPALGLLTHLTCQSIIGIDIPANLHAKGVEEAPWMQKPLFRHLYRIASDSSPSSTHLSEAVLDSAHLFRSAATLAEAGSIVSQALMKKLSKSLSALSEDMDADKPLHAYGVDSLLAVELRTWVAREFAADVPIFEILGGATFTGLGISVARKSRWEVGKRERE